MVYIHGRVTDHVFTVFNRKPLLALLAVLVEKSLQAFLIVAEYFLRFLLPKLNVSERLPLNVNLLVVRRKSQVHEQVKGLRYGYLVKGTH